ncbi:MAG: hypothetical protein H6744_16145 [Deltaproteobacteria bacterium]|nr:hypothetical protein [Deltaproteobacteria bacterium]
MPGYLRYVDDFFLFSNSRAELRQRRADLGGWLASERGLRLKHPEARVLSCRGHLDALGKRITRDGVAPLPRTVRRLARRAGAHARGERGLPNLERSMASSVGVVMF